MGRTFSDEKFIYSVDMMLAYVNIFKPNYENDPIEKYIHNLDYAGWGDPANKVQYSPREVLKNPDKYKGEMSRIKNAELKYPILVCGKFVIDGVHRLTKAHLEGKEKIRTYNISKKLLQKFKIANAGEWDVANSVDARQLIEIFWKKFAA